MIPLTPPPLPATTQPATKLRRKILITFAVFALVVLASLRPLGLLRPFKVPTGAMAPAILPGDHFMMEGCTYLFRTPRRGDIIVFKTDGIWSLPRNTIYIMRVAGESGDQLRLLNGKLYVNGTHVSLRNANGEIHYDILPGSSHLSSSNDTVTVSEGHYFVLGDNSSNSLDSRFWGFIPAKNVMGRPSVCYWPPERIGGMR